MSFRLHDYLLAPERVDERLARLIRTDAEKVHTSASGPLHNIQASFLEATEPRHVVSRPRSEPDALQHPDGQELPSSFSGSVAAYRSSDLPLDVFLEIASRVSPLDLIHLTRTSKPLRRLLMSKNHRAVWRGALGNVPDLPPCLCDIDEPLYAALVFSQSCFECGADDAFWVDYALRLRMCEQCYKANIVEGTEVLKSVPQDWRDKVCDVVLMLVPSANTFDFSHPGPSFERVNPLSHLRQDFYFKPNLKAMLDLFWPFPSAEDIATLRPLVRARASYLITRQTHAVVLHGWDNHWDTLASGRDDLAFIHIVRAFNGPTFTRLRGPDWDETSLCEDPALTSYLSSETSQVVCLASKIDHDPPKPHHQLTMERLSLERRDTEAREARVRGRFAEVAEWHQSILARPELADVDRNELPNAHAESQLWEHLVLEDDARGPLDRDSVMSSTHFVEHIARTLAEYPEKVKRALAAELLQLTEEPRTEDSGSESGEESTADGDGDDEGDEGDFDDLARKIIMKYRGDEGSLDQVTLDAETILLRPPALFVCTECGDGPHAYPEINMHWQREHWDKSVWMDHLEEHGAYGAVAWKEAADVAERILAVLIEKGLPEDKRDMWRLDELVGEGGTRVLRDDLSWAELVDHVFTHLNDNSLRTNTATAAASQAPVWLDDHNLASCIKYLPDSNDTSEASKRVTADESTRERIRGLLSQCPEKSLPACHLCDMLTPDDKKDSTLFLTENVDGVVYHMQAKHGKQVEEKDIVFWEESMFDEPLEPADL